MTLDHPLLGFRQDRIGARMICLLDMLRLCERFGTSGRYAWLSQPNGPYPELADPADFLSPKAISAHVTVVETAPERGDRENLRAAAPGMNSEQFATRLAQGQRFLCDSMSDLTRFTDEQPAAATQQIRRIAVDLELSAPIRRALETARKAVARAGGGQPVAIHVRRGDILDADPWSYSSWPSKYVPDEFFRAFVDQSDGPVIAFSDTPAAVAHLAAGNPRILPVAGLFDDPDLSVAQRDLLELLLMGGCATVGAPRQSAYSQAASIIGGVQITALPAMLPDPTRNAAHAALLDRAMHRPDSFFAPGDLAQSLSYAAGHAMANGQGAELVKTFADRTEFLDRFPFLYRELAVTALTSGRNGLARRLARQGLKAPLLRNRDKPQCKQVLMVLDKAAVPDGAERAEPAQDMQAQFLTLCFSGKAAQGMIVPALAHQLLSQGGRAAQDLMFAPQLATDYQRLGFDLLSAEDGDHDAKAFMLPLWTLRSDWIELISDPGIRRDILIEPNLPNKLAPLATLLAGVERILTGSDAVPDLSRDDRARLGFCAAQLRLHGRLKRAFALLHWLDAHWPNDPMTHKRLADACFAAGNLKAASRWLGSAIELAPDNTLLKVAAAQRFAMMGQVPSAQTLLDQALQLWPELELTRKTARRIGKAAASVTAP